MPPNFASQKADVGNEKVLRVDTSKATYQGQAWKKLSDTQKRKFENLLFLNHAKDRPKIIYQ